MSSQEKSTFGMNRSSNFIVMSFIVISNFMFGGCGKEMFMNGPKKTKFILWEA